MFTTWADEPEAVKFTTRWVVVEADPVRLSPGSCASADPAESATITETETDNAEIKVRIFLKSTTLWVGKIFN